MSDAIDYEIFGSEMQFAEVTLDPGEMVIAEAGRDDVHDPRHQDGNRCSAIRSQQNQGFLDKVLSAGKRVLTGESLFMTTFTNARRSTRKHVAFAAPYPGKIMPLHLDQLGGELICQKDAFLCAPAACRSASRFKRKSASACSAAKASSCSG